MTTTTKPVKPNLFARATSNEASKPKKKEKGTVLVIPQDLDSDGKLQGESKFLNEAVDIAIKAKREMDAAKGRLGAAVGLLSTHAEEAWCATYATGSVKPPTPVTIQNHDGSKATYVVQDKCGQNHIDDDQIELLGILLGTEVATELVETRETYSFDPAVMEQAAEGPRARKDETVQDVIFGIVSDAIGKSTKLSDDQKTDLIVSVTKKYMKKNTLPRLAELCGSNVGKIQSFLQAAGSAIVRYIKT